MARSGRGARGLGQVCGHHRRVRRCPPRTCAVDPRRDLRCGRARHSVGVDDVRPAPRRGGPPRNAPTTVDDADSSGRVGRGVGNRRLLRDAVHPRAGVAFSEGLRAQRSRREPACRRSGGRCQFHLREEGRGQRREAHRARSALRVRGAGHLAVRRARGDLLVDLHPLVRCGGRRRARGGSTRTTPPCRGRGGSW